jgi:hypothetical protein
MEFGLFNLMGYRDPAMPTRTILSHATEHHFLQLSRLPRRRC